jgi:hypothetical protein
MTRRKAQKPWPAMMKVELVDGELQLFIVVGGIKIAKRGQTDTPQAKT